MKPTQTTAGRVGRDLSVLGSQRAQRGERRGAPEDLRVPSPPWELEVLGSVWAQFLSCTPLLPLLA